MLSTILIAIGVLVSTLALRSLRAHRLKERYALLYLCLGLPFLGLAAWPDAVGYLAERLGIEYQTVILLSVTTFFLLMNMKLLSIVSRQEQRITTLTQVVGLLTVEKVESRKPKAESRNEETGDHPPAEARKAA